jgi:glucosamine--fructose-6-phosphate aminotransferase (isomerizing)
MLSYVLENGSALERTIERSEPELRQVALEARARGCTRVVLSGVGSSYTAAWATKIAFDTLVDLPAYVLPTNELAYYPELVNDRALVVILSRSGERKRVIEGMRVADERNAFTVAVTGAPESLMAQLAARTVLTGEGPEASFPKTKSVTCGIGVFLSLALALSLHEQEAATLRRELAVIPAAIDASLAAVAAEIEALSLRIGACDRLTVAGTAGNAGVAMEVALMFQESASLTTQWADTGNLFHGPLCPLDERWLVALMVAPEDAELVAETVGLVRAFSARSLVLAPPTVATAQFGADYLLPVADPGRRIFWPLLYLPVLQLLGYYWTVARGLDPDSPRGSDIILKALVPAGRQEPEALLEATAPVEEPA